MGEHTLERRVGRLVEARHTRGFESDEEMDQFARAIRGILAVPSDQRLVAVSDWRNCKIMSPKAAAFTLTTLQEGNLRIERSAVLYDHDSALAGMQFMRLLRDAGHPGRKLFTDPLKLTRWLDEVLTPEESARLYVFLGV